MQSSATNLMRVLVVDDSVLYRKILSDILAEMPGIEVMGTAANGKIALGKIERTPPDLVTLDVEMPIMDGLETLEHIKKHSPNVQVLMVSSHTAIGVNTTLEALSLGAFDFITKPEENDWKANQENLRTQLKDKLSSRVPTTTPILPPRAARPTAPQRPLTALVRIDLVAIGISTGGPKALAEVIPALPGSLRVPIVIVQHMPTMFTSALAQSLDSQSIVKVVEATTGLPLQPATVYIAPGGKQMRLAKQGALTTIEITDDPPENFCKPAVDYLFRSVAEIYGSRGLGVIMTGMGADGTQGLRAMKQQGSPVMAQDEATCVVYGMPQEAVKAGVVDTVLPLNKIAGEIARICTP